MHFISRLIVLLFVFSLSYPVYAAREWVNPDAAPEKKAQKRAPVRNPASVSKPVVENKAVSSAPLAGRLSLETIRVCDYQLSYQDKGSGGKIDGSFFLPRVPEGYAMIGGYAQGNYHPPSDCVLAVKPANEESISLLQVPDNWQRIWKDKGSGASKDGSVWHASPRSGDYVCLGSVAQPGYKQPTLNNYVCVHRCLVEDAPFGALVWSTKGTGSKQKLYTYKLNNSNSFYSVASKERPPFLQDLKAKTKCNF